MSNTKQFLQFMLLMNVCNNGKSLQTSEARQDFPHSGEEPFCRACAAATADSAIHKDGIYEIDSACMFEKEKKTSPDMRHLLLMVMLSMA